MYFQPLFFSYKIISSIGRIQAPVSYTQLDVYKRQLIFVSYAVFTSFSSSLTSSAQFCFSSSSTLSNLMSAYFPCTSATFSFSLTSFSIKRWLSSHLSSSSAILFSFSSLVMLCECRDCLLLVLSTCLLYTSISVLSQLLN